MHGVAKRLPNLGLAILASLPPAYVSERKISSCSAVLDLLAGWSRESLTGACWKELSERTCSKAAQRLAAPVLLEADVGSVCDIIDAELVLKPERKDMFYRLHQRRVLAGGLPKGLEKSIEGKGSSASGVYMNDPAATRAESAGVPPIFNTTGVQMIATTTPPAAPALPANGTAPATTAPAATAATTAPPAATTSGSATTPAGTTAAPSSR